MVYSISRVVTCDYHAWNAEIIPFVLRIHQRAFRYLIYPNTLRYLPQHGIIAFHCCVSLYNAFIRLTSLPFWPATSCALRGFGKKILNQTKSPVATPPPQQLCLQVTRYTPAGIPQINDLSG